MIDDLADTGRADGVLVCPQGFVADHLEVLYDLDVRWRPSGRPRRGLAFARTRSVNDDRRSCSSWPSWPIARVAATGDRAVRRRRRRDHRAGRGLGAAPAPTPTPRSPCTSPGRSAGSCAPRRSPAALVDEGADAFLARVPEGRDAVRRARARRPGWCRRRPAGPTSPPGTRCTASPTASCWACPPTPPPLEGCPLVGPDAADRVAAEPDDAGRAAGRRRRPERRRPRSAPRFGDDVLERLVDPLLGGINAGDSDRLSLRAAAPQLAAAAERSGSLVEGLRHAPPPTDPTRPGVLGAARRHGVPRRRAGRPRSHDAGVAVRRARPSRTCGSLGADGVVVATPRRPRPPTWSARPGRPTPPRSSRGCDTPRRSCSPSPSRRAVSPPARRLRVPRAQDRAAGCSRRARSPRRSGPTSAATARRRSCSGPRPGASATTGRSAWTTTSLLAGRARRPRRAARPRRRPRRGADHPLAQRLPAVRAGPPRPGRRRRGRRGGPPARGGRRRRAPTAASASRRASARAGPPPVLWLESALLSPSSAVSNRRIVVLAWLIPALLAGCGAAGAKTATEPPAAVTTTTTSTAAPVVTTTTWPLSMPIDAAGGGVLRRAHRHDRADLGPRARPRRRAPPGPLAAQHRPRSQPLAGHGAAGAARQRGDRRAPGHPLAARSATSTSSARAPPSPSPPATAPSPTSGRANEIVTPDRVDIADQRPAYTATLFACHPPGSARERIVAFFRLVGAPAAGQPDPATLPAT